MEKPHLMTLGREKNDLSESHVEWELDQVIHPPQQISSEQRWAPALRGWGDPKEEDKTAMAHQTCKSTLLGLYNNVACEISPKHICKDMEFQQYHLVKQTKWGFALFSIMNTSIMHVPANAWCLPALCVKSCMPEPLQPLPPNYLSISRKFNFSIRLLLWHRIKKFVRSSISFAYKDEFRRW